MACRRIERLPAVQNTPIVEDDHFTRIQLEGDRIGSVPRRCHELSVRRVVVHHHVAVHVEGVHEVRAVAHVEEPPALVEADHRPVRADIELAILKPIGDWHSRQQFEGVRVRIAQSLRDAEAVEEYRAAACRLVADAVKKLEAGRHLLVWQIGVQWQRVRRVGEIVRVTV